MKIYILAINDLHNVGYNCKDVEVFTKKEDATRRMRELYLKASKELHDADEDPYAPDTMDYQFESSYAYFFREYYWDIFEKEIPEE